MRYQLANHFVSVTLLPRFIVTCDFGGNMKGLLIYTVHKAASMFLHRLTNDLSKHIGFDYYSINKTEYFDQIKSISWKKFIESKPKNSCFGPIRAGAAEPSIPEELESYSIVLHLRDPRDVLVSLFFVFCCSFSDF